MVFVTGLVFSTLVAFISSLDISQLNDLMMKESDQLTHERHERGNIVNAAKVGKQTIFNVDNAKARWRKMPFQNGRGGFVSGEGDGNRVIGGAVVGGGGRRGWGNGGGKGGRKGGDGDAEERPDYKDVDEENDEMVHEQDDDEDKKDSKENGGEDGGKGDGEKGSNDGSEGGKESGNGGGRGGGRGGKAKKKHMRIKIKDLGESVD